MAAAVERTLEETVPVLRTAQRLRLLRKEEIRSFVAERRHHEYTIMRPTAERKHFLSYIACEARFLQTLTTRLGQQPQILKDKREALLRDARLRVNLIYSRAVKRFRGDAGLWLHYVHYLIRQDSPHAASRVLASALAFCGSNVRVWQAAISFHFDNVRNPAGARALAHRALRALPKCAEIWIEYFRLELFFLARLVESRVMTGYSPEPIADEDKQDKERRQQAADFRKQRGVRRRAKRDEELEKRFRHVTTMAAARKNNKQRRKIPKSGKRKKAGGKSDIVHNGEGAEKDSLHRTDGTDEIIIDRDGLPIPDGDDSQEDSIDIELDDNSDEDDPDGSVPEFWYGAVPLAVLRRGCENVSFTAKHRAQLFNIAAGCPWISPQIFAKVADVLRENFPSCQVLKFVTIRLKWEQARADLDRVKAVVKQSAKGSKSNDDNSTAKPDEIDPELKIALMRGQKSVDKETSLTLKLMAAFREHELANIENDVDREGVMLSFEGFKKMVNKSTLPKHLSSKWRKLETKFTLSPNKMHFDTDAQEDKIGSSTTGKPTPNPLKDLLSFIEMGKYDDEEATVGDVTTENYVSTLLATCVVPFRNEQQDKLLRLFLSKEPNAENVHRVVMGVEAVPPMSMELIQALIAAEMRTWTRDPPSDSTKLHSRLTEMRKLFLKGSLLPEAKQDIGFWLSDVQFERQLARCSKSASSAHSKALRILESALHEPFTERQLLSNLSSSL